MSKKRISNFIGNEWVPPRQQKYMNSINPANEEVLAEVPNSTSEDIEAAVLAAQNAFASWKETPAEVRSQWLLKIADEIEKHQDELAKIESEDQGKPLQLAKNMDIARAIQNFRFFAGSILHHENESSQLTTAQGKALNYVIRKPVGVCGLISPWNLPLYLLTWKIAPAVACGNTVVCKPSELTSLTAAKLCELIQNIKFPAGVINMVFGDGMKAGDALVKHPQVPLISFTGGTETGKKIMQNSAQYFKKLSLELGGKNANIIFADCDYDKMLKTTIRSSFLNQGEICLCGSRIYVEESLYEKFINDFVEQTKNLTVGDPLSSRNFMGALVSEAHLSKVQSYVEQAKKEGGKVLCGGERLKQKGYFFAPTILTSLEETSVCIQEEIFGPVVTVSKFKNIDDVIKKANGVKYGLSASVWTQDVSKVLKLGEQLEAGTLWVNSWLQRDLRMPFGGMKASGLGREGGKHSIDFFSELTTVCVSY
jgi:acyl-CoA reductase-like NAD-dependent aldehyde dehydrogenase